MCLCVRESVYVSVCRVQGLYPDYGKAILKEERPSFPKSRRKQKRINLPRNS